MKKLIIPLVLIVVIGSTLAGIWLTKTYEPRTTNPALRTWIDRGVPLEIRTRLEAKIAEIVEKIGGDREVRDLNSWLDLGIYKNTLGDLAGARDAFTTATELNPVSHVAWGNLGDTLAEIGDLSGAERAYEKALDLVSLPVYYEKYANFLEIYYPNRTDDLEALLQRAVAGLGQEPWLIARLAQFYEAHDRLAEARSHLEVLVRLLPDDASVRRDLERVERKIAEQTQ